LSDRKLGLRELVWVNSGARHPIRAEVFEQTVRESGPAEKRACEDVFAALQRIVDAKDPSYRD